MAARELASCLIVLGLLPVGCGDRDSNGQQSGVFAQGMDNPPYTTDSTLVPSAMQLRE